MPSASIARAAISLKSASPVSAITTFHSVGSANRIRIRDSSDSQASSSYAGSGSLRIDVVDRSQQLSLPRSGIEQGSEMIFQ